MTRKEQKAELRVTMRAMAAGLSEKYKARADAAIAAHLTAMPEYQAADVVFCYVGTGWEINTRPILEHALNARKTVCVPRCEEEGIFTLRQITSLEQLAEGAYGILEPDAGASVLSGDQVDFAVLPCLTCNHLGQRLGQGGGYYDRFLSHYRGGAVLLCREKLIREEIPLEPLDMPVPWVLTENGLYEDGTPARLG